LEELSTSSYLTNRLAEKERVEKEQIEEEGVE
jgi:hypothetical protein